MGSIAVGGIACGGVSAGLLAFGGVAAGCFAIGGFATGQYLVQSLYKETPGFFHWIIKIVEAVI